MSTAITERQEWVLKDEGYHQLIETLQATLVEGSFSERMARIETYHKIGEEIRHYGTNTTALVKEIAKDLNIAERSIWSALKFYDTYPDLGALPDGKAISWTKVKKLIGAHTEPPEEVNVQKVARNLITKYGEATAREIAEVVLQA
jgi:hypothetical protein